MDRVIFLLLQDLLNTHVEISIWSQYDCLTSTENVTFLGEENDKMSSPHFLMSLENVGSFITSRKGHSSVFTDVSHSFCPGGSHDQGILHPQGICIQGKVCLQGGLPPGGIGQTPPLQDTWDTCDTTGYGQQAGGTHSSGMHSCKLDYFYSVCFISWYSFCAFFVNLGSCLPGI